MGILQNLQKFRVRSGSVTEITKAQGIVARAYRTHIGYKHDIPVPRVFVALAYRTSRSSGYGFECTELPEAPGTGMNVLQNFQKLFVGYHPAEIPRVWFVRTPTEHNLANKSI